VEIVSSLGIIVLIVGFGSKLFRRDDGVESVRAAERIFFEAMNYARFRAIYYHSVVRFMIDVSDDSEYSHRKIIVALKKTGDGGQTILEKQKEILLPRHTFFIPKTYVRNILPGASDARYFWDNCLFTDGGKTLTMAFRDIDSVGMPMESSSVKPILYAVGAGSCKADASNKFSVKFLKDTKVCGGVLLPGGIITTLDSPDKIIKLLQ
jgi:hypothetical protein